MIDWAFKVWIFLVFHTFERSLHVLVAVNSILAISRVFEVNELSRCTEFCELVRDLIFYFLHPLVVKAVLSQGLLVLALFLPQLLECDKVVKIGGRLVCFWANLVFFRLLATFFMSNKRPLSCKMILIYWKGLTKVLEYLLKLSQFNIRNMSSWWRKMINLWIKINNTSK